MGNTEWRNGLRVCGIIVSLLLCGAFGQRVRRLEDSGKEWLYDDGVLQLWSVTGAQLTIGVGSGGGATAASWVSVSFGEVSNGPEYRIDTGSLAYQRTSAEVLSTDGVNVTEIRWQATAAANGGNSSSPPFGFGVDVVVWATPSACTMPTGGRMEGHSMRVHLTLQQLVLPHPNDTLEMSATAFASGDYLSVSVDRYEDTGNLHTATLPDLRGGLSLNLADAPTLQCNESRTVANKTDLTSHIASVFASPIEVDMHVSVPSWSTQFSDASCVNRSLVYMFDAAAIDGEGLTSRFVVILLFAVGGCVCLCTCGIPILLLLGYSLYIWRSRATTSVAEVGGEHSVNMPLLEDDEDSSRLSSIPSV